jgi:hypothetical protein
MFINKKNVRVSSHFSLFRGFKYFTPLYVEVSEEGKAPQA